MKSPARAGLCLVVVGSIFAFSACGDDDSASMGAGGTTSHGGSGQAGQISAQGGAADSAIECEVIGELCHEADTGSGPAHICHQTGHQGDGRICSKEFESCISTCVSPDGGAGGAPSGSEPDARCAALGELCHPVDDKNGPLHACHELGHEGDGVKCAASFSDCATRCLAARAALAAGTGGAGGVSSTGGAGAAGGNP
jgi:hypothetical protein